MCFALATNLSARSVTVLLGASETLFRITGLVLQVGGILTCSALADQYLRPLET